MSVVTPALGRGDVEVLRDEIDRRWKPADLCGLLSDPDLDVRRTAVVTMGLVGDRGVIGCLTRCLHDADAQVHQFAEDALWSIWFRIGNPAASERFRKGLKFLSDEDFVAAAAEFNQTLDLDPDFAEAYNQLAIAHYLSGEWDASISACRRVLALMPTHFGAMAGLGHGYAHRGELKQAIDCYRRALAINPQMTAITDAKQRLEAELARDPVEGKPFGQADSYDSESFNFEFDPTDRS